MKRYSFKSLVFALMIIGVGAFSVNGQQMSVDEEEDLPTGNTPGTFNFGGRVGLTFGTFKWNQVKLGDASNNEGRRNSRNGFALSGFFTYHLTSTLSVRGELGWFQTGHANVLHRQNGPNDILAEIAELRGGSWNAYHTYTLNYLNLDPVLVVNPLNILERLNPHLVIGPSFAWNIGSIDRREIRTELDNNNNGGVNVINTVDYEMVNSEFNGFDFGINIGLGVPYAIESMPFDLVFDVRYRWGLSNINQGINTSFAADQPNTNLNTSTWTMSVGVQF